MIVNVSITKKSTRKCKQTEYSFYKKVNRISNKELEK